MFLDNKYTRWYYSIINKALSENRVKGLDQYYENHHIIPKCMEGKNTKDNLVLLTAREHFVSHLLLCRMIVKNSQPYFKLLYAVLYFRGGHKTQSTNRYTSSYLYQSAKIEISRFKKETCDYDKDIERRLKISETMKIVNKSRDKSVFQTEEWKKQCSINGKKGAKIRIEKNKNIPKKSCLTYSNGKKYSHCYITKNGIIKKTTINQLPQYKKYGWKRMVLVDGVDPSREQASPANKAL